MALAIKQNRFVERSLHESEELFRTMANCAPVLLWMAGRDKLCNFFNQPWLAFTGRSLEQEIGNGWAQGVHPDEMDQCLKTYHNAFDEHLPFEMEYRLRRHDGEYRWVLDRGAPRFALNGEFMGYVGSAVDITEHKRAHERSQRLAHLERRVSDGLSKVLDNTPFLLTNCSRDLRYLFVSDAYARMIGRPAKEVIGKPIVDTVGPEGFETMRPHIEAVLQGKRVEYEAEVDFANVGPRHLQVIYVPERDQQNQVVGWIASILDVSEHKKAREEMELLQKELSHVARVVALGEMSAGIAHELSQPLAAILANASAARIMLADDQNRFKEAIGGVLEDIIANDTRASELIQRFRQLLRKEDSRPTLINLNDLVASSLAFLRSEANNRNIKVETDLKIDLPLVSGDSVQLQQVLLNLMMNAMDAMSSIMPSMRRMSVRTTTSDTENVEVSVRDHGVGLSSEQLKRVFEPFFTTKKTGLGLGLSICSTIVTSHRGRLTLSNASDGGAIAVVSLPSGGSSNRE
jgi:PAS domain S-box-containing protein